MKRVTTVLGLGLMFLAGCALYRPVRGSSLEVLTRSGSSLLTELSPQDAARTLVEQFGKRGFQIADRRERTAGEVILTFKGSRTKVDVRDGSGTGLVNEIGSVFFAQISTAGGTTRAFLFGKPALDGRMNCNEAELGASLTRDPCDPVEVEIGSPASWRMTGQEEAEVIQSIALELEVAGVARRPPGQHRVASQRP